VTLNGPYPTLALPLVEEVWKWDWMSDVSPSISKTTFAARTKAVVKTKRCEKYVGDKRGDVCKFLLTCGVHREEVVFSQLLFAVEFGDFGADGVSLGVHQTGEGDGSRADTTK